MSLKIGHITYANCAPFFHYLAASGFVGEIIKGVPAELNQMLAAGEIDICPASSIEYALHSDDYRILPGHSISSIGPVQSVLLFSDLPLSGLNGVPISITGESATSVALLRVVLQEFYQLDNIICQKIDTIGNADLNANQPLLLIGDRALKARLNKAAAGTVIDLGELWYHFTGLPFVFALWIVKRLVAEERPEEVAEFRSQLDHSRNKAFASLDKLASESPEKAWMGVDGLAEYWRHVSYDLDPAHIEGLRCFYLLLEKHGLIEVSPEICFFSDQSNEEK
ncbi:MAG: futalosine synthase [Desulfuromonas sp.]|nr:MAG: futalosine synthase [Desulfuromonas sp.]